jgi:hypothetical protein
MKKQANKMIELDKIFPRLMPIEEALKLAASFSTQSTFRTKKTRAFKSIQENCPEQLEKVIPRKKVRWTLEKAIEEAKKYESRTAFYWGAKAAFYYLYKHAPHLLHKPLKRGAPYKWTLAKAIIKATQYKSRSQFFQKAKTAFYFLYNNHYILLLFFLVLFQAFLKEFYIILL